MTIPDICLCLLSLHTRLPNARKALKKSQQRQNNQGIIQHESIYMAKNMTTLISLRLSGKCCPPNENDL